MPSSPRSASRSRGSSSPAPRRSRRSSLGALGVAAGARVVVTDSIPRGLYRIVAQAPVRGSVAGGCLPPEIAADVARSGAARTVNRALLEEFRRST